MTAARAALDAKDPDLVLHWVRPEDEAAVKAAFRHTIEVRRLGSDAQSLADRYFFETLVRIHRAGEGAPYTGLTDGDPEPIIAATDRALAGGSTDELENKLVAVVRTGLAERFAAARTAKNFRPGDVAGGRAFVAAYVPLTHWVEGVSMAAEKAGDHHGEAVGHDVAASALRHEPGNHDGPGGPAHPHANGGLRHLPWVLTGLLAIVAVIEGLLLWNRRKGVSPLPPPSPALDV
ncbi:MAG TPA: DUF6448 family protein [Polyangia bacterium]